MIGRFCRDMAPWLVSLAAVASVILQFGIIRSYAVSGTIFQVLMGSSGALPPITQPILSWSSPGTAPSNSVVNYGPVEASSAFNSWTIKSDG